MPTCRFVHIARLTAIVTLASCVMRPSAAPLEAAEEPVTNLKSDERIVFFPTTGWLDEKAREWVLPVHGWVFEPEEDSRSRTLLVNQLKDTVGIGVKDFSSDIFTRRSRAFLVDNERSKEIVIRIAERTLRLAPSTADGHLHGVVRLAAAGIDPQASRTRMSYSAVLRAGDRRQFSGIVQLVPPEGRTIVSDIDDTVKITEVGDKKKVLENTLLRPFRPVPGMSDAYRRWAEQGVHLHWVSSSPWQLYEPLAEFFAAERFPDAAWRLKQFRLKDSSILALLADPEDSKVAAISEIIERHPRRKFTLVGDSGERDPEAYGRVAAKYPQQVDQVFIRDVTNQEVTDARYQAAWKNVKPGVAAVFRDPSTLRLPGK